MRIFACWMSGAFGKVPAVAATPDDLNGRAEAEGRLAGPGRMAIEVAERHASLLAALREEMGDGAGERFAAAAQRLASDFGEVTATAVEAAYQEIREEGREGSHAEFARSPREESPTLARPGHRPPRRHQLSQTNRRYGHPFGLAVFDT